MREIKVFSTGRQACRLSSSVGFGCGIGLVLLVVEDLGLPLPTMMPGMRPGRLTNIILLLILYIKPPCQIQ